MIADNDVYAIMWSHLDNSGFGIVNDVAYEDYETANIIRESLVRSNFSLKYEVFKINLIQGCLLDKGS